MKKQYMEAIMKYREVYDIAVVEDCGNIDIPRADSLRTLLIEIIEKESYKKVVINLENTNSIRSIGIGVLIAAQKKIKSQGGEIRLCALEDYVKSLVSLAQLDNYFNIYNTLPEAISAPWEKGE